MIIHGPVAVPSLPVPGKPFREKYTPPPPGSQQRYVSYVKKNSKKNLPCSAEQNWYQMSFIYTYVLH